LQFRLKMKIYKKDNRIMLEIECESPRLDFHGKKLGSHSTIAGLITIDSSGISEMGFAYVIDMQYKNKSDQCSDIFFRWFGTEQEFREKCAELNLKVWGLNFPHYQ